MCHKCVERIERFHDFYQEVAQNQQILQYSQPITADDQHESQIIITNDLTKTIHLPYVFNLKGVVTLQPVPNVISTFDLSTGTTTIDLHQFTSDVTQDDDHNIDDNLIARNCNAFETVEIIDELPVKLIADGGTTVEPASAQDLDKTIEIVSPKIEAFVKEENNDSSSSVQLLVTSYQADSVNNLAEQTESIDANQKKLRSTNQSRMLVVIKSAETINNSIDTDYIVDECPETGDHQTEDRLKTDDETEDVDDINGDPDYGDSDDDDDDNGQDVSMDEIDLDNEKFIGFPKYIIKNSKLIIRGKPLLEMMSRFYRMECDLCPAFK